MYSFFFKLTDADGDSDHLIKCSELYALADIFFYSVQTMIDHFELQSLGQFPNSRI